MSVFRDVILDACLHCYSYDRQIEGTRADYMYELVSSLPDKQFYFSEILKSLTDCGDDNDGVQRFHMAACMALDGNEDAKRAMYKAYNPGPSKGESLGFDFIKVDGIRGLLFVADRIGALLLAKGDEVDSGWLMANAAQPEWDALKQAATTNSRIAIFYEKAKEVHAPSSPNKRPDIKSWTYSQLLTNTPANNVYYWRIWGMNASESELKLAAEGLLAATEPKQQSLHLRIFQKRTLPFDPQPILALTGVKEERVGFFAVGALRNVAHPSVRALAFRLVNTKAEQRGWAIDLIDANFMPGDHQIVLKWLAQEEDRDVLHAFGLHLTDFWDKHPDPSTEAAMLHALYECSPCSHCRWRAVRGMLDNDILPVDLRAECAFDANDDIRELVGVGDGI